MLTYLALCPTWKLLGMGQVYDRTICYLASDIKNFRKYSEWGQVEWFPCGNWCVFISRFVFERNMAGWGTWSADIILSLVGGDCCPPVGWFCRQNYIVKWVLFRFIPIFRVCVPYTSPWPISTFVQFPVIFRPLGTLMKQWGGHMNCWTFCWKVVFVMGPYLC